MSLHPLAPWAEYLRHEDRRTLEARVEMRMRIWALRVDLEDAVLLDFESASQHGLSPTDLVSDDYRACQVWATGRRRAHPDVVPPIIVPSAALPGTKNVVLFGPRVAHPFDSEPQDELEIPTALVGDMARPPEALVPSVCFRGQVHAELNAFDRRASFGWTEPLPALEP